MFDLLQFLQFAQNCNVYLFNLVLIAILPSVDTGATQSYTFSMITRQEQRVQVSNVARASKEEKEVGELFVGIRERGIMYC
jgi:uncharacterized membrane protein